MGTIKENDSILFNALKDLDALMVENDIPPVNLKIIGGFALLCHNVRKDTVSYTDIDYIGPEMSKDLMELAKQVGMKHHLGTHWINNDFLLTGNTLEDIEEITGKLRFTDSYRLNRIHLDILSKTDLLKLKIIAIDTSLTAVASESTFSRVKDLSDISLLVNDLSIDLDKFIRNLEAKNLLINENTKRVVETYMNYGITAAQELVESIKEEEELDYDDIDDSINLSEDFENELHNLESEIINAFNLPKPEDFIYE